MKLCEVHDSCFYILNFTLAQKTANAHNFTCLPWLILIQPSTTQPVRRRPTLTGWQWGDPYPILVTRHPNCPHSVTAVTGDTRHIDNASIRPAARRHWQVFPGGEWETRHTWVSRRVTLQVMLLFKLSMHTWNIRYCLLYFPIYNPHW